MEYHSFSILKKSCFWNSCFFFPFRASKTSLPCLLTWFIPENVSAVMYVFIPSCNAAFPPFWWLLRFLSLSLVLSNLKTTCFGVFFSQYVLSLGVIELLGSGSSQTTSNLGTSNFYQYVFKYSLLFFLSSPQSPLRMCQAVCSCFIAHGNVFFFFF